MTPWRAQPPSSFSLGASFFVLRKSQRTGTLVTSHGNLQQILGGGQRQFAHAKITMISRGTVAKDCRYSFRVPSTMASVSTPLGVILNTVPQLLPAPQASIPPP